MKPTLLVMAAGMGSRFGGAKQIEPVGPAGETLLDYSVFDALRAGFGRVVFIIRRDFETVFRERVGRRFEKRVAVDYAFQELDRLPGGFAVPPGRSKPWGTGHAVWCAADTVREPFAAINADDFYGRDAFAQLAAFFERTSSSNPGAGGPARFAMAGYRIADTLSEHGTVSRGVCRVDERGRLAGIEELTAIEALPGGAGRMRQADERERILDPGTLVSMNCWGFNAGVFPLLDAGLRAFLAAHGTDLKSEFYLPAAIAATMAGGRVGVDVLPVRASWFGVTYREDKPRVVAALAALVAAGQYPPSLWV